MKKNKKTPIKETTQRKKSNNFTKKLRKIFYFTAAFTVVLGILVTIYKIENLQNTTEIKTEHLKKRKIKTNTSFISKQEPAPEQEKEMSMSELQEEVKLLKHQIQVLNSKIEYCKINSNKQTVRILTSILDIKQAIKNGDTFNDKTHKIALLSNHNMILLKYLQVLHPYSIKPLKSQDQLKQELENIRTQITKDNFIKYNDTPFTKKIKTSLLNLISIKKVSDKYSAYESNSPQLLINNLERQLDSESYEQALRTIENSQYSNYFQKFKQDLGKISIINNMLDQMINYLGNYNV